MLLFAAFILLLLFLIGFVLTCKMRAKKGSNYDDLAQNEGEDLENELADMSPNRSGKQRYSGLESESDDEEEYQY